MLKTVSGNYICTEIIATKCHLKKLQRNEFMSRKHDFSLP